MNYEREKWKASALKTVKIDPSSLIGKMICAQFDVLMDRMDTLSGGIVELNGVLTTINMSPKNAVSLSAQGMTLVSGLVLNVPVSKYEECKDKECDCCKICNRVTCICGMKVKVCELVATNGRVRCSPPCEVCEKSSLGTEDTSFFHCDCPLKRRMKPMHLTTCKYAPVKNDLQDFPNTNKWYGGDIVAGDITDCSDCLCGFPLPHKDCAAVNRDFRKDLFNFLESLASGYPIKSDLCLNDLRKKYL